MPDAGARTVDLAALNFVETVLGHHDGALGQVPVSTLSTRLAATGPLAERLRNVEAGMQYGAILRAVWAELALLAPSGIGQRAEVLDSDLGVHADPQSGETVQNAGLYTAFGTAPGQWTWLQPTSLAGKANSADLAPVATSGAYADLADRPVLGSAAGQEITAFASAAQGARADSAVQPAALEALATAVQAKADQSAVASLQEDLATRAPANHTHGLSAVTGLQAALEGKAGAESLAATEARTLHAADRPGDNPGAFSATLTGAGAGKAPLSDANTARVPGAGLCQVLTGAGVIALRNPVALGRDVWQVTARLRRLLNPADPNNHAISLRVAWLDAAMDLLGLQTLLTRSDALTASGTMTLSARLSALDVEGVIAPPPGAVYACPYLQTYGEDGATAVETLRAAEITDLALAEIGNLSEVVAAAEAAIAAATAASLVETETLDTMAAVASYTRPEHVGVLSLKGGYAAGDGFGGQWYYDPTDTTSASAPPAVLVGADDARYKPTAKLPTRFDTVAAMRAFAGYLPPGWDVEAEGHRYRVAAAEAPDPDLLLPGGVKLHALTNSVLAFGGDDAGLQAAHRRQTVAGGQVVYPAGTYSVTEPIVPDDAAASNRVALAGDAKMTSQIQTGADLDLITKRNRSELSSMILTQTTVGTGRAVTTPDTVQSQYSVARDLLVRGWRYAFWSRYSLWDDYRNLQLINNICGIRLARREYDPGNADAPASGGWNLLTGADFYNNQIVFNNILVEGGEVGIWGTMMGATLLNVTTQGQQTDGAANDVLPDGMPGTGLYLDWRGDGSRGWQNIVLNHYSEKTRVGAHYKDQRYVRVLGMFAQGGASGDRARAAVLADNSVVEIDGLCGQDFFETLIEARNGAVVYLNSRFGPMTAITDYSTDATSRIKPRGIVDRNKHEYALSKPAAVTRTFTIPEQIGNYGTAYVYLNGLYDGSSPVLATALIQRWTSAVAAPTPVWLTGGGAAPFGVAISVSLGGTITIELSGAGVFEIYATVEMVGGRGISGNALVLAGG